MDEKEVIQSQYFAALAMLKQAILLCPPADWEATLDKDQTWFKAYHALYYAHKYLQSNQKDFVLWKKHHKPDSSKALSKEEALQYLAFVEEQVTECIPPVNLGTISPFLGKRLTMLEVHLINIRHIQEHTGELLERLGSRNNIQFDWAEQRHHKVKK
jgi:hypothetical protein